MRAFLRSRQAACVTLLSLSTCVPGLAQEKAIRVGTVLDGPRSPDAAIRTSLESEVDRLLGSRFEVLFPLEKQLVGDWSAGSVRSNIDSLLSDPEVDAVLVFGIVGAAYVTRRRDIPKPVVASAVFDPETSGIPVEVRERPLPGREGVERYRVSGVTNLSYISYNQELTRELETFREIAPFSRHLAILLIEGWMDELAGVLERLKLTFGELGVQVTFLPVGASVDETLEGLPANTEAVMLSAMPHLSSGEFERLVAGVTRRKLPTYSLWGQRDVRRGVMACLQADRNTVHLVRRIALNLFNLVQGEDAAELPVDFEVDEQLTINMTTARAVNVDPTFALLTRAEVIGEAEEGGVHRVSLSSVVREAASVNLDLKAAEQRVAAGFQLVREARSALWPQASLSSQGSVFRGSGRQVAGAAGISQLVYSEQARSSYDVERQIQKSRGEQRSQLRLDTILQAARGYLAILRTKTIEKIEKSNLRLTRSNLRLARTRVEVGTAGRDEVLRWLSQIAQNRRRLIDAWTARNRAEIVVNGILDRPIEEPFETSEAGLDDPELTVNFEVLRPYIKSPRSFRLFREFMAREAFDGSPELRRLDAEIRAQQRRVLASRRALYIPQVSLDAQARTFRNRPLQPPGRPNPNADWTVGFSASLPVFQGGLLRAQKTRSEIQLNQLTTEREAVRLAIEQNVRSALHLAGASFAGIELAREAAAAAQENLELVLGAYSEGSVNIVRVLDAQSQSLSAQLEAANSVFNHLIDLMATQRAAGRFDYFRSPQERDALVHRLEAFFQEKGYPVRDNE